MDPIKIQIRNYRSIPYNNPIEFEVGEGITMITGINNIGKSNLLKLFYEFRPSIYFDGLNNLVINPNTEIQFNNGYFFSNILNQNSKRENIELKMSVNSNELSLNIEPRFNSNLDDPYYRQTCIISPDLKPEEIKIIVSLFSDSMYIGPFRTPTFQSTGNYYDIQIGHSFISTWDSWTNGNNTSTRKKIRLLKEELKNLFGFNHFDIYPNQGNTNLIVETDNGIFNLDELGGGISHFILVLANAMIRNPSYILIDEPENGLHPKMQEMFLRTLSSKAKIGLIATSHSIGLARSIGADRIYTMSKDKSQRILLTKFGENFSPTIRDSLNELGYSQFVELGGNNILLVEGRTDIKSFKEILKLYNIEQHFIIMDLGGANFINGDSYEELAELKRLNAKSYSVIFDSEFTKDNDTLKKSFQDFISNCESLNYNVFATDYHSTENYITQEAIEKVIGNQYPALNKYESMESIERKNNFTKWGKNKNWLMFREMEQKDFENTQLHLFITEKLIPLTK